MVEIDEADFADSRADEHGRGPGTDATAADDDDEGFADRLEAGVAEEDAVARELLEDQFYAGGVSRSVFRVRCGIAQEKRTFVVVSASCPGRKDVVRVFEFRVCRRGAIICKLFESRLSVR